MRKIFFEQENLFCLELISCAWELTRQRNVLKSELLPGNDFTILTCDRENRSAGGVLLAVRNTIPIIRRRDLECNTEILTSEIRPQSKRKIVIVVLYRPPNAEFAYIKDFKNPLLRLRIPNLIT